MRRNLGLEAGIPLGFSFPKTAKGTCLMTDSPRTVEPEQFRDLHIELKVKQPTPTPQPKA
ncbi:MAG: hypothetical protein IH623_26110 [Verrucomicrobia bacterium]|nr:hypothetical protein [Verrucomicrobiota bacterium]